jgi:hypothetical protein
VWYMMQKWAAQTRVVCSELVDAQQLVMQWQACASELLSNRHFAVIRRIPATLLHAVQVAAIDFARAECMLILDSYAAVRHGRMASAMTFGDFFSPHEQVLKPGASSSSVTDANSHAWSRARHARATESVREFPMILVIPNLGLCTCGMYREILPRLRYVFKDSIQGEIQYLRYTRMARIS